MSLLQPPRAEQPLSAKGIVRIWLSTGRYIDTDSMTYAELETNLHTQGMKYLEVKNVHDNATELVARKHIIGLTEGGATTPKSTVQAGRADEAWRNGPQ